LSGGRVGTPLSRIPGEGRGRHGGRLSLFILRNNPAATELEDLTFDGTAGAVFELAADLISFRSVRRKLSPEQAKAAAANLRREAA